MSTAVRLAATTLTLLLAACSTTSGDRLDYKGAKSLPSLEVPPELSEPADTGSLELPVQGADAAGQAVLPQSAGVRLMRDGEVQWLQLETGPERLWPKLREFWPTLGLTLARDVPAIGIMETEWAENRADVPGGFITDMVRKVFADAYSADTRDKFRLRLERGEEGGSEIYISHYGLKETVVGKTVDGFVDTAWSSRPADPELALEVMKRLALYLGGETPPLTASPQTATVAPERAWFEDGVLVLDEGFARAWRRTGIALDRLGLVVEDRNRSRGIYYLTEVSLDSGSEEEKGWFASLFGSEEKAALPGFQLVLRGDEVRSRLTLLTTGGEPAHGEVATELLKRLQAELK